VHRAANGKPLLTREVPGIRAIAADTALADAPVPVIDLNDAAAVADAILANAEPLADVLRALDALPTPERLVLRRSRSS
jgi:DNA-directed RNA polymerase specialized sigma24 family protein